MHGLYVWWWVQENHVAAPVVAAILAGSDLLLTALEVPTGWLADRCGHRISLIVGSVLQIAGMLFAWLGIGMPGVFASAIVIATGDAFRSGADQALLYRSCASLARESDFQRIEGRTRGAALFALVAQILAGGAIVSRWGFGAGWAVETALCAIGLAIAFAMREPPAPSEVASGRVERSSVVSSPVGSDGARGLNGARGFSRASLQALLPIVLPAAFLGAMAGAATFVLQLGVESTPARVTMVVAGITLAEAVGSFIGAQLRVGIRWQAILLLLGIFFAITTFASFVAIVPGFLALSFLGGLAYPIRAAAIQRLVSDDVRARAASIASACDKGLATIALLAVGGRGGLH